MDSDTIIRELESRAMELESEAHRLREAAGVIRGHGPSVGAAADPVAVDPRRTRKRESRTMPLIVATLGELGPLENVELTDALLARGWETKSANPSNTVRTALGRLIERDEVVRLEDGRFVTVGQAEGGTSDG